MTIRDGLYKAIMETGKVIFDDQAKPGEVTILLRQRMAEYAREELDSELMHVFDIFDTEGYEPYREYCEKELGICYPDGDRYLVLAHTLDGQYLLGGY